MAEKILCPYCRHRLPPTAFRCSNCGNWFNNEVFQRLSDRDIELIKSQKDMVIMTPTFVCIFLKDVLTSTLKDILKTSHFPLSRFTFEGYCFSRVIRDVSPMKKGSESLLKSQINWAMVSLVLKLFKEKRKVEYQPDTIEYAINKYAQLDRVLDHYLFDLGGNQNHSFLTANEMGEIVYKKDNSIPLSLVLFASFFSTHE